MVLYSNNEAMLADTDKKFHLIRTKLHRPDIGNRSIARPRLISRLNAGLDRRITLISAPAVVGKTAWPVIGSVSALCDVRGFPEIDSADHSAVLICCSRRSGSLMCRIDPTGTGPDAGADTYRIRGGLALAPGSFGGDRGWTRLVCLFLSEGAQPQDSLAGLRSARAYSGNQCFTGPS